MKLNNKGFTLVELLAVVVILIAISAIAIPTISSSIERSKDKQYKAKIKIIESAAKLYVSDHQNVIDKGSMTDCNILVSTLIDEDYVDEDDDISEDSCVWYDFNKKTFEYEVMQCDVERQCGFKSNVMLS